MIKELDDYVDKVHKLYKYIPKDTFRKILLHGFRRYFDIVHQGGAVYIGDHRYSSLCCYLTTDHNKLLGTMKRYRNKKLHMQYSYMCKEYDGIYYFGVTEDQKEKLFTKDCEPITCFKIKEECLQDTRLKYFYILYYPVDRGWSFTHSKILKKDTEYFAYRDERNKIIEING